MSLPFTTLQEFIQARDSGKITLSDFDGVLDKYDFKKLIPVFTPITLVRLIYLKKWLKEVARISGVKIRLKMSLSAHRPYMTEGGEVGLSVKDFLKPSYCFFAIAHETAHFILQLGGEYGLIKSIDAQYSQGAGDGNLRSPTEYCANIITIMIFNRCLAVTKKERYKKKLSAFIAVLKGAIDNGR